MTLGLSLNFSVLQVPTFETGTESHPSHGVMQLRGLTYRSALSSVCHPVEALEVSATPASVPDDSSGLANAGPSLTPKGLPSLWSSRNRGEKAGCGIGRTWHIINNCLTIFLKVKIRLCKCMPLHSAPELALLTCTHPHASSGLFFLNRLRKGLG